jgi:signal transduction histidine kinase
MGGFHRPGADRSWVRLLEGLPPAWGDEGRRWKVLMRWPTDALRCAPASGRITIEAQLLGDQVRVSVRDTGAGIASEDLPYAFDRFYRAEKSRARADGGSGLGLAIARHLVEAHGGASGLRASPAGAPISSLPSPSSPAHQVAPASLRMCYNGR